MENPSFHAHAQSNLQKRYPSFISLIWTVPGLCLSPQSAPDGLFKCSEGLNPKQTGVGGKCVRTVVIRNE
jgi:hypothetical protein